MKTISTATELIRRCEFSPCRAYRYTLWREWDMMNSEYAMFIGLNPSTADETQDDPTIRRCIDFSKQWGYGAFCMTNLFAFRATDPKDMKAQKDPVGPNNDKWLELCAKNAGVIVAAWGRHGKHKNRQFDVLDMHFLQFRLKSLGENSDGTPKHPLYLRRDSILLPYS